MNKEKILSIVVLILVGIILIDEIDGFIKLLDYIDKPDISINWNQVVVNFFIPISIGLLAIGNLVKE